MPTTIDPASKAGARTLERLAAELIGWLTTDEPGRPAAELADLVPVGRRRGAHLLRQASARATGTSPDRPLVAFNLNTDAVGGDVVDDGGRGPRSIRTLRPAHENPAYVAKYQGLARRVRLDGRVVRRRVPGRDPRSDRRAGASGEPSPVPARPGAGWRSGPPSAWRPSPGAGRPVGGWWPGPSAASTPRRSWPPYAASERAAGAARDADRGRPPRRLAAVGPRPARARRPRPRGRAAPHRRQRRPPGPRRVDQVAAPPEHRAQRRTTRTTSSCWRIALGLAAGHVAQPAGPGALYHGRPRRRHGRRARAGRLTIIRSAADLRRAPRAAARRPGRSPPACWPSRARTRWMTTRPTSRSSSTPASG